MIRNDGAVTPHPDNTRACSREDDRGEALAHDEVLGDSVLIVECRNIVVMQPTPLALGVVVMRARQNGQCRRQPLESSW